MSERPYHRGVETNVEELRAKRFSVSRGIDTLRNKIRTLEAYIAHPPAAVQPIVAQGSGQILSLSREEITLLRLSEDDPRRVAVLEKLSAQSEQQTTEVNGVLQKESQERLEQFQVELPRVQEELVLLRQHLEQEEGYLTAVQAQIDQLMGRV